MAVNKRRGDRAYGLDNALQELAPVPIPALRAPGTNDLAEIGTTWIDVPNNGVYVLTSISAGAANWETSPASGATELASLTVTPGDLDVDTGNVTFAGTLDVTGETTVVDLVVDGDATFNGDLDISSSDAYSFSTTSNTDPAFSVTTNGGSDETIIFTNSQGTSVDSIDFVSTAGGLTFTATGLASDDAINFEANAGGIDADAALQINIDSSEEAADAIRIFASGTAGGLDIDCGTGGAALDSTGAISLDGAAASNVSVSGAGIDLSLVSAGGRVVVNGEEVAADALRLLSAAGGLDADVALQMNLASSQAAADAIRIDASDAAGGIDVDDGGGGMTFDSLGAVSIDAAAASNMSVSGAGIDLSLVSAGGRVVVNGEEAAADALRLVSAAGGLDTDVALQLSLVSSQAAAADSVRIQSSAADGGIDVDSGTGGHTIDSTGAISIDGAAASNFSVSGAGIDLTLASAAGRVVADGGEAAADAVRIVASDAAGGIDIDAGTGGITVDSGDAISFDSAAASNFTITGAGDLTLAAGTSSVNVTGAEADAAAVLVSATNASGGITLDAGVTPGVTVTNGTQSFQILTGSGSPNGSVTAAQGSLYVDVAGSTSTTILFVNTDASTTWLGVGA